MIDTIVPPCTNRRVVDLDSLCAVSGTETLLNDLPLHVLAETPLPQLATRFCAYVEHALAPLRRPLHATEAQILDDYEAIKAIAPIPERSGAIFRPVPNQQFTVEMFEMDWESVGAMCDDQGLTLVRERLGVAHYCMEVAGITTGGEAPQVATVEIQLRKAKSHTIVKVLYDLAPEGMIRNFVVRASALLQFSEAWQYYCDQYIDITPPGLLGPPPLPPKPSNDEEWITVFEHFQKYHAAATNADLAAAYGYSESHVRNKRSQLNFLKRSTKKD